MDIDEKINEHNQKKFKDWIDKERVVVWFRNDLTDSCVKVTMEGSFIDVKNLRDKIYMGHWHQEKMVVREKID